MTSRSDAVAPTSQSPSNITVRHDFESAHSISTTVVTAVSDAVDVSALDLPPLSETIDADALNALFRTELDRTPDRVSFTYVGCRVTVRGDGTVAVTEASE
ncbi:hypothetical protein G9464_12980 [Halostella sp. JP-L12]|uniref:HalOD1 output domain-containing protein n=1 Tax=Halostella TaxID=1843185 RepID=UPI000EF76093|nr:MULTISPECIES: HalOD1 output domain-containing protein [Halostella]NHN48499.1 hypothetical protein [Halostella sp. JP-L12]